MYRPSFIFSVVSIIVQILSFEQYMHSIFTHYEAGTD